MASSTMHMPIVRNKAYRLDGRKSYVYALNKYQITPTQPCKFTREDHHGQSKLMVNNSDGTTTHVSADDQMNDSFYTVDISIGQPAQVLPMDLDSGSSDCWVMSTKLPEATQAASQQNGVKLFDPEQSTTSEELDGYNWKISYGDNSSASGIVYTDIVQVGNIKVENQCVEVANQASEQFQSQGSSGLVGMAFGNINTVQPQKAKTLVENMIAQKDITNPLWSVYLGSVKDLQDPDQGKSFYQFGGYDESIVQASGQNISWAPVDPSSGFWLFSSESATINGKTLSLSGNQAIADTGTTLMLCSDEFCGAVYGAIDGAKFDKQDGLWLIPTDGVDKRPDIKVAVGQGSITLEKEQLAWQDLGTSDPQYPNMSIGGIQSRGNFPSDIFGDVFLVCTYSIFDVGNTRYGVVQRPDPTPAGSASTAQE